MSTRFLRNTHRRRRNYVRIFTILAALLFVFDAIHVANLGRLPQRVPPPPSQTHERIFIASIHWFNERILRSHWNKAVVELVKHLGPENVFVSLVGSKSPDNTLGALQELDAELEKLHVPRSFVLEKTTHEDQITRTPSANETGWIWTPRGKKELRRIPYLADLRNRVMQEMNGKARKNNAKPFDKVLWLNDVVFSTEDVLALLSTNAGEYASACSLDFSKPPIFYDTFALRDINGAKALTSTWPYLSSSASRQALMHSEPVPVQSCWNGMVAMDAKPFYEASPLKFRGIPDGLAAMHLEGSECCLVHADNSLSALKGVFLNPNVRVGYNPKAYDAVHTPLAWPSPRQRLLGIWKLRLLWFLGMPGRMVESFVVNQRMRQWQAQEPADGAKYQEAGSHCLINEMQVLVGKAGWKHL